MQIKYINEMETLHTCCMIITLTVKDVKFNSQNVAAELNKYTQTCMTTNYIIHLVLQNYSI